MPPSQNRPNLDWQEEDQVWKASKILDQLDRFEGRKPDSATSGSTNRAFGHIPRVPWLDAIAKKRCEAILNEAKEQAEVSL